MATAPLSDLIDAPVKPMRALRPGIGVIVGALAGNEVSVRAFGRFGALDSRPVDARTMFEIGSVTKPFTASLLAVAARAGYVRLDEPVGALLPELNGAAAELTLLRLATHTSGLPRLPSNLLRRSWLRHPLNPYASYSRGALAAAVASHRRPAPPTAVGDTPVSYSNFGRGLLGTAPANRLGTSFEDAMLGLVCAPLGLHDTRVAPTPVQLTRSAHGHSSLGIPVPRWRMPALEGAGALRTTMDDLLRFAAANLGDAPESLLAPLRDGHRVRVATYAADGRLADGTGLGWHAFETVGGRHRVHWHNGATFGCRGFVAVVHALRVGVAALAYRGPAVEDRLSRNTTLDQVALQTLRTAIELVAR